MKAELLVFKTSLLAAFLPSSLNVWCVFLGFVLFSGFEQLIEWEDRNELRENKIFVPRN